MQKKLNSTILYKGNIFTLSKDKVKIENQMIIERDVIHHNGGCAIIACKDDCLLMVRQYRYAAQQELYEIPAGKIEAGEDPAQCAIREFEEETGYACTRMQPLFSFYSTPGFCTEAIHLFEADHLYRPAHKRAMDDDECIEIAWVPIAELYRQLQSGMLKDAKTIIALQHVLLKNSRYHAK